MKFDEKIQVVCSVGDIRMMINDLPDSMPVQLLGPRRSVSPVFAIEKDKLISPELEYFLEIRNG